MEPTIRVVSILLVLAFFAGGARAQIDEICREVGILPSLDSPFAHVPYVYGRITLKGYSANDKRPDILVIYSDNQRPANRLIVGKSGNYCFSRSGGGGTLVVEVNGLEAARRSLPTMGPPQQREDFEVTAGRSAAAAGPGVVSAKFLRRPNEKTIELYIKAATAENEKRTADTIQYLREIVKIDPDDFIAWGNLGSLLTETSSFEEANTALRRAIEIRIDYTPAWLKVGQLRMAQRQHVAAIEIFKHAVSLDPTSAWAHRLLGEAYLQARQGNMGVHSLDAAIKLDPVGMAECHLLKARLFDLAGARHLAAAEYKIFLQKVPNHVEKKKLQKYISEHSEK